MAVGVDRFSVNEVLRLAGGSKATLVKYFGDRSGLIAAVIGAEAADAVAALRLDAGTALPLDEALAGALAGVLEFYLQPGSITLYRAVVGSADAAASQGFYAQGHGHLVAAVAGVLEARKGIAVRADLDSAVVADQLLHMVRAGPFERLLLGLPEPLPTPHGIAAQARAVVALVLPGLAPPHKAR